MNDATPGGRKPGSITLPAPFLETAKNNKRLEAHIEAVRKALAEFRQGVKVDRGVRRFTDEQIAAEAKRRGLIK